MRSPDPDWYADLAALYLAVLAIVACGWLLILRFG